MNSRNCSASSLEWLFPGFWEFSHTHALISAQPKRGIRCRSLSSLLSATLLYEFQPSSSPWTLNVVSSVQGDGWALFECRILELQFRYLPQAVSCDNCSAYLTCFPPCGDHCSVLPIVQCLKTIAYVVCFHSCLGCEGKSSSNYSLIMAYSGTYSSGKFWIRSSGWQSTASCHQTACIQILMLVSGRGQIT